MKTNIIQGIIEIIIGVGCLGLFINSLLESGKPAFFNTFSEDLLAMFLMSVGISGCYHFFVGFKEALGGKG